MTYYPDRLVVFFLESQRAAVQLVHGLVVHASKDYPQRKLQLSAHAPPVGGGWVKYIGLAGDMLTQSVGCVFF